MSDEGAHFDRCLVVTASIGNLHNLASLPLESDRVDIVVLDEGDTLQRRLNKKLLKGWNLRFYGPRERTEWFQQQFGSEGESLASVIPERCHAETSFGFLVALDEEQDFVVEIDDDCFPERTDSFIEDHYAMLCGGSGIKVHASNRWYNTLECLKLTGSQDRLFPRGHPYEARDADPTYEWVPDGAPSVLHMGHWLRVPDLDALTYIERGFLQGHTPVEAQEVLRSRVIVGAGTYFSVCSMNTSFRPKIIPGFYQLYMNFQSVDRFDDIWSGLILKRIADQIGDTVSLGLPAVRHEKRPRDLFLDLAREAIGMGLNERLWKVIEAAELTSRTYIDAYREMAAYLHSALDLFEGPYHGFLRHQVAKMNLWVEVCDKLT